MADRLDGKSAGRPSKYQPSYCDLVIEHMADGASLTSFAAEIGVSRATINVWMDAEPEFLEAVKKGKSETRCLVGKACCLQRR
jgi:hypothetical protein